MWTEKKQWTYNTPFWVNDKINTLKTKLSFAKDEAENGKVPLFPCLESFVEENELSLSQTFLNNISDHYQSLHDNFSRYFQEYWNPYAWVKDPFDDIKKILPASFSTKLKEELFELNCDSDLKEVFNKTTLIIDFWIQRRTDYSGIGDRAIQFLLPFTTSYLCEAGFSSLVYLKNKYPNRLSCVENEMRLKLSPIKSGIVSYFVQFKRTHHIKKMGNVLVFLIITNGFLVLNEIFYYYLRVIFIWNRLNLKTCL